MNIGQIVVFPDAFCHIKLLNFNLKYNRNIIGIIGVFSINSGKNWSVSDKNFL
jgi:hypothetical protein